MLTDVHHMDGTTSRLAPLYMRGNRKKSPLDAGGPSAEPLAEGKIEPKDWKGPKNVYQARQKLEYINRAIDAEHAARVTRVGSN